MTSKELIELINKVGLKAIKVAEFDDPQGITMTFEGDINEYLESVKKLDSKVVFINVGVLSDHIFTADINSRYDDRSYVGEEVDLSSISTEIADYKKYIGKDSHYHLLAVSGVGNLVFHVQEDWWNELLKLLVDTMEKLSSEYEEKLEARGKEEDEREAYLIKKLNSLKKDEKFVMCRTQKIKLAYALAKYPELEELDPSLLKSGIANLSALLEAELL